MVLLWFMVYALIWNYHALSVTANKCLRLNILNKNSICIKKISKQSLKNCTTHYRSPIFSKFNMKACMLCFLVLAVSLYTTATTTTTTTEAPCPSRCYTASSSCMNTCYNTISTIINNIGKRDVMETIARQRRFSCYDTCRSMYNACCGSH